MILCNISEILPNLYYFRKPYYTFSGVRTKFLFSMTSHPVAFPLIGFVPVSIEFVDRSL